MNELFGSAAMPLDISCLQQLVSCPFSLLSPDSKATPEHPTATIEDVSILHIGRIGHIPAMKPKKAIVGKIKLRRK